MLFFLLDLFPNIKEKRHILRNIRKIKNKAKRHVLKIIIKDINKML